MHKFIHIHIKCSDYWSSRDFHFLVFISWLNFLEMEFGEKADSDALWKWGRSSSWAIFSKTEKLICKKNIFQLRLFRLLIVGRRHLLVCVCGFCIFMCCMYALRILSRFTHHPKPFPLLYCYWCLCLHFLLSELWAIRCRFLVYMYG